MSIPRYRFPHNVYFGELEAFLAPLKSQHMFSHFLPQGIIHKQDFSELNNTLYYVKQDKKKWKILQNQYVHVMFM